MGKMRKKRSERIFRTEAAPWMGQLPDGVAVAPVLDKAVCKPVDVVGVEQETGSGGVSTDVARESSIASPRLMPAPDSPPLSVQLSPEPSTSTRSLSILGSQRRPLSGSDD